ncbi:hypothetical protein Pen02_48080 [Plantactinospora endophytica]|uniref:Uncharacterized protein n=1 Tax=Plantactinospora endophytica TaxID=673535 RepID=A0ABQ4E599_9ACTN|nr:hypothetical protein Pen02_48080 [Plantactinospora endophytica]
MSFVAPAAPDYAAFRAAVRRVQAETAIAREAATMRSARPVPERQRTTRYAGWNSPTRAYPRLTNGRAGNLTPAQESRARHGERI